jgi:ribosome-associated protein
MAFREGGPPVPEEAWRAPENQEQNEADPPAVPESEISIDFVRSSGPGGQNVNKVSSKAQLRWKVGTSAAFSEEQKALIREAAGKRLNSEDEICLYEQGERSQQRNRDGVVRRLQGLVAEALAPKKERKPTRVSRSEKMRRLEEKRRAGEQKRLRKPPRGEW